MQGPSTLHKYNKHSHRSPPVLAKLNKTLKCTIQFIIKSPHTDEHTYAVYTISAQSDLYFLSSSYLSLQTRGLVRKSKFCILCLLDGVDGDKCSRLQIGSQISKGSQENKLFCRMKYGIKFCAKACCYS